jgi:F-type H+-transporting ATPase subunit gamma
MAKARAIIKRRKAVDNIRKITRTMELIATARYRKAMDRAIEAEAYTRKIAELVSDLGESSRDTAHALFERRDPVKKSLLLVLSSNRGLAGGYNGNVLRAAFRTYQDLQADGVEPVVEVSGKRGMTFWKYRRLPMAASYTQFEDKPQFDEVEKLADRYVAMFLKGEIDRLDVAYTESPS